MAQQQFTAAEKRREVLREIGQREHVYPRLVDNGKLTQAKADRQIAIMKAVLADYDDGDLFAKGGTTR